MRLSVGFRGAVAIVVLLLVGCQGGPGGEIELTGAVVDARVDFHVDSPELDDLGCPPSDLTGTQLLIQDGSGNTLATANLDESEKMHATAPPKADATGYRIVCSYPYAATVPSADFYELSLPSGESVTYPKDEVVNGPASLLLR